MGADESLKAVAHIRPGRRHHRFSEKRPEPAPATVIALVATSTEARACLGLV
jgi:hypothetical protein